MLIFLFTSFFTILDDKDFNSFGQIFKDCITDVKNINKKLNEKPNIDSLSKQEDCKDSLNISRSYKFGIKMNVGSINKSYKISLIK